MFRTLQLLALLFAVAASDARRTDYRRTEPVAKPKYVAHEVPPGAQDQAQAMCKVDVYLAWQSLLGSGGLAPPVVADFDQDGRKEVIFSTSAHFVESLLAHDGEKADGWPLVLGDSNLMASPLVYDVDGSTTLDVVVTTEAGNIVFVSEAGIPLYDDTLRISPVPMPIKSFEGLTDSFGEAYWEMMRQRDPQSAPAKYRHRGPDDGEKAHWSADHKKSAVPDEDEFGFPPESDLTEDGVKSLELFMRTNLPLNYVHGLMEQRNPLYSRTYQQLEFDEKTEVLVPPHVLATPVIADLERDGVDELIVPVSYFYSDMQRRDQKRYNLNDAPNADKFSVAGIVVFDLFHLTLRWQTELGATLTTGSERAFMYSSPVVADLNGDGVSEIVVVDGSGHIHVLDAHGALVKPWPIQMAPLAAQPVVEDVDRDGKMEIIVLDAHGNLACFDWQGNEKWLVEIFTGSVPPLDNSPTMGDVNGDGMLDVVIGTAAGYLYAIDALTGQILSQYPVLFPGPINSEVVLAHVRGKGLHLIFPCAARLYIVDGANPKCMDSVALGEDTLSTVSVDDFTGNKHLDMLVSMASGQVLCFSSDVPYHPLNTWSTPWSGGTKVSTNYNFHGIYAENRGARDVTGTSLPLRFTIVDRRTEVSPGVPAKYNVSININGARVFQQVYTKSGSYMAHLPVPDDRNSAAITLWMENEVHQVFTDFFSCSFNVRFYRLLKYVLIAPLLLLMLSLGWALSVQEKRKNLL